MGDERPKADTVFVSYTHDTPEHENRVWELSERLRNDGIDCRVDQQEESPAEGWPRWCRNRIKEARFVLVVCTETYRKRYEGDDDSAEGLGGKWEGYVITQQLYKAQAKSKRFVPVVFSRDELEHIPEELDSATHYDLSAKDGYGLLLRRISGQPKRKASPVAGKVPDLPPVSVLPILYRKTQAPTSIFTVPLPENPFFTERGTELADLKEALEKTGSYALTGLGGVGKTQTAAEYAHRQRDDYKAVIWLRAEKEDTLFADLSGLVGLLQLPEAKAPDQSVAVEAALRWLDEQDDWLMVLDNVTGLKSVSSLTGKARPQRHHVIVTQQALTTGTILSKKKLGSMADETGALLLLRRAGLIEAEGSLSQAQGADADAAKAISAKLGGLPLALDQAGAYISEKQCGVTDYLELVGGNLTELLKERGELEFQHVSVMATYSTSLTELEKQNEAAAELLKAAAFLAPDAIPEEIFTEGASEFPEALQQAAANRLKWNDAIAAAFKFSLLERNPSDKTIAVHRMVQAVARSGMKPEEREQWAERVVGAVNAAFPGVEFTKWSVCDTLLPHAQVCAALIEEWSLSSPAASRLLNQAGLYLRQRARYAEAEALYRRALAIDEQSYGPDHPDVAIDLNNLAQLLQATNRLGEAEPLMKRVVSMFEKSYGVEHPNVATALNNLAQLLQDTNRLGEAEPLMKRALAIDEQSYGPEHPKVAIRLNNLAQLLQATNRLGEAEPLMKRALAIDEESYGAEHPTAAIRLNNLAQLMYSTNRMQEAEPLMRRALAIDEKSYGPDHPNVAIRLNNLAGLLQVTNRVGEAEPLMKRALAIDEKSYGPEHPDVAIDLNNLAGLLRATNRLGEAEPLYKRAVVIVGKSLGPDHPSSVTVLSNYRELLQQMGYSEQQVRARLQEIAAKYGVSFGDE